MTTAGTYQRFPTGGPVPQPRLVQPVSIGHFQEDGAQQGRDGEIEMKDPGRLFLQHQRGVSAGRFQRLELGAAIGQTQPGQVSGMPLRGPRLQSGAEQNRVTITDGQQLCAVDREPGDFPQRHIGHIADF